ncbi:MAG: ATP phosphoribosyltransferase [Bacillota bacterium]
MQQVTIALAKGRLSELTIELLERCNVDCRELRDPGRRLILSDGEGLYRFLLVKPADVPTYVHYGVADIGVAGKDTLMEANLPLYEMLDLGFGRCRLCICGFPEKKDRAVTVSNLRVATKYPLIASQWYHAKGQNIDVIKLHGSVELGPLTDLADVILDVVESGKTLEENGLVVLEQVGEVSARVVVNRVSLKTKSERICALISALSTALEEGK